MPVLVISGISTSGKTTIAEAISPMVSAPIISLDTYFTTISNMELVPVGGTFLANYDIPSAIEWDMLIDDLKKETGWVILDGFIPFGDPRIEKIVNAIISIEYSSDQFQIALKRRIQRGFHADVPPDYHEKPDASAEHASSYYFETVVWKEAEQHPEYRVPKGWKGPILSLNATDDLDDNIKKAGDFAKSVMNVHECYLI